MFEDLVSGEVEHAEAGGLSDGVSAVAARLRVALEGADLPAAQAAAFQPALDELLVLEEQVRAEYLRLRQQQDENPPWNPWIVARVPVPAILTDSAGRIIEANPAAEELVQIPAQRLTGKPLAAIVAGPDRRRVRDMLSKSESTPGGLPVELAPGGLALQLARRRATPVRCRAWVDRLDVGGCGGAGQGVLRCILVPDLHPEPPRPGSGGPPDLRALGTLVRLSITSVDIREALHHVAVLSAETQQQAGGQAWASVIVGSPQAPTLLTCSSQHAQGLEGLQFAAGEGPSFEAVRRAETVTTPDLGADQRWPRLRAAVHLNPTWCVAAPLLIGERAEGVLSVYGTDSRLPVRDEAIDLIKTFAAGAQRLLQEAQATKEIIETRDQLEQALISRAVIEQAKGMIMMARECDADGAFQYLVGLSNARNQKLRDIAGSIVAGDAHGLEPTLDRHAAAFQPDAGEGHACQMGRAEGSACTEPAEVKLTDSWGDIAWSCLNHGEEALLGARGVFLATKDPGGLAAYLKLRRQAVRSH